MICKIREHKSLKKNFGLAGLFMMGLVLCACEKRDDNGQTSNTGANVKINDKQYDLSKDCDEVLQKFIDDMYIANCPFEEEKEIRKIEYTEYFDEEQCIFVYEDKKYYQLDENGTYVEVEPEDFDDRVVLEATEIGCNSLDRKIEDVHMFGLSAETNFNSKDFRVVTSDGISIGDTVEKVKDAGGYDLVKDSYTTIYIDGEFVDYEDYSKDAERIQKLDYEEWSQEIMSNYKYYCLPKDYMYSVNKLDDTEMVMYLLAEAEAYSKIRLGVRDTMTKFVYHVTDGKVESIDFYVINQSEMDKVNMDSFKENMLQN